MSIAKIKTREEIAKLRAAMAAGKRVAYTSGVFDLLHPGHTDYLERARACADVLIVGVNSDKSVRLNKGELRPVCPAAQRAEVVAALASVDYVFVFDERNNNRNVELLRPDIYVKAGDYDKARLSSAALVEAYGGRVEIMPVKSGFSTTAIIERIAERYATARPVHEELPLPDSAPAIFVDRDGTIIEHVEYLHDPAKLAVLPGALEALKELRAAGFRIIVITNQPGIGLGYFTIEQFFKVNTSLLRAATRAGLAIDRVYFCPHNQAEACACRKPATGMLERAVKELNVRMADSYMIGDTSSDVMTGIRAGCHTVLVRTGVGGKDGIFDVQPEMVCDDLAAASRKILAAARK